MNIFDEVIGCFDETFERCTNLTSDDNDRVSQCAHEFVFELTRKGYKSSQRESKLMRSMYPSFKEVDLNDDGMLSTINDLTKILNKTEQLLQQYPDNQSIDPKLYRLLHMKPKDNVLNRDGVNNDAPIVNLHLNQAPRRQSQVHAPPPRYHRPAGNIIKPRQHPSFIQKRDEPMQHKSLARQQKPLEFKPQNSILPEEAEQDDENDQKQSALTLTEHKQNGDDDDDDNIVESPKASRPYNAQHRGYYPQ